MLRAVVATTAVAVAMAVLPLGLPGASAAPPGSGGTWGQALRVTMPTMLSHANASAGVETVSCASPGNCSAGGSYQDQSNARQAYVVNEVNGVWGTSHEVPGTAALNVGGLAEVAAVSCPSPGYCSAVGDFAISPNVRRPFVVDEVHGVWGTAEQVPKLGGLDVTGNAFLFSLSCASRGNCSTGGWFVAGSGVLQGVVVSEVNGTWGDAIQIPQGGSLGGGDVVVNSVSCGSAGNCTAGGSYGLGNPGGGAFVVDQVNGAWGNPVTVESDGQVASVSCASAGNCSAAGEFFNSQSVQAAFVANEVGGIWHQGVKITEPANGDGAISGLASVSCSAAGDCLAGGLYADKAGVQALVVSEVNGAWSQAQAVPGTAALNVGDSAGVESVSCAAPGNCAAVGSYYTTLSGDQQGFVADQVNGVWDTAIEAPGLASLNVGNQALFSAVSCSAPANCSAGGSYMTAIAHRPFVISETKSSIMLAVSTETVVFGDEQAARVSLAVTPDWATGIVTVTAVPVNGGVAASVCQATVKAGSGSCRDAATGMPAGKRQWRVIAAYHGSAALAGSTSAPKLLTVLAAKSASTLTLSAAAVTFGHQATEKFTVVVRPQFAGQPAGKVIITATKSGGRAVKLCEFTLKAGTGSCHLRAGELAVGSYRVTATYQGSSDFRRSAAPKTTLNIKK